MVKVGSRVVIPAGTRVTVRGNIIKRTHAALVTVRKVTATRAGNSKVTWKSDGYPATAVIKA